MTAMGLHLSRPMSVADREVVASVHDPHRSVVQYEVGGLPPRRLVLIRRMGERWCLVRNAEPYGRATYPTPEAALDALREELDPIAS